jgi:hypothetical protein
MTTSRYLHALLGLFLGAGLLAAGDPGSLRAQEGLTTGSVAGTVLDAEGRPLPGVEVRISSVERGGTRTVRTDGDGRFSAGLLPPGLYRVRALRATGRAVEAGPVRVRVGERAPVRLRFRPVEAGEITVTATRAGDPSEGGVVNRVDEEQIDGLPTSGRDFTDFIALSSLVSPQPGLGRAGGQFSIGGARTSGTNLQIDGVDATNSFFGENRGSRRIPFTFSLQSIREYEVVTNGYDVEFGKYSGGVVNAVTKSGTNELEGEAFLFWRDEALTADGFDGTEPTNFQSFQFGGHVSGPIVRDELHFFVAADLQQRDQPAFALTPERSGIPPSTLDEFQDVLVDVYGFDRAEVEDDFGVFDETQDQLNLFGRLDWNVSEDHRLTVRANYSDFENENDLIAPDGTDARTSGGTFNAETISGVAELSSRLSPRVSNVFRVQVSEERRPRPGNSDLPTVQVEIPSASDGVVEYGGQVFGTLFSNDLEERKLELVNNLTVELGDHALKVGTDNLFTRTENRFWLFGNGFFSFESLEDFRNREPSSYLRLTPSLTDPEPPSTEFDIVEWSGYVQDEWQATPRLTLTAGLRYGLTTFEEGVPLADPTFREIVEEDFGRSTTTVPEDRDNLSPRLAFSWDVEGDASQILRGGAGIFHGRVPSVLHANVLLKLPDPLLTSLCLGSAAPDPDLAEFRDRTEIPSQCRFDGPAPPGEDFGIGITGAPQVTVWDSEMDLPRTFKANLGYERSLGPDWRAGLEAVFSRTHTNYTVQDLNLRDEVFRTAAGRPVHVPRAGFDPTVGAPTAARAVDPRLDRLFLETDAGRARSWNFQAELAGRPLGGLRVDATYNLSFASDNSSFFCCIEAFGLFGTPTAGNPNEIGGFGDDETGAWGASDFERRHTFVANALWEAPAGVHVGAIYRLQSGNPYTPSVNGDLNGDGDATNDRPYLPDPDDPSGVRFATPEDRELYREALAGEECLRESVGEIISRNTCRDPMWHSVDLKLRRALPTFAGQRAELVVDLFNVLDGLGIDAGEFVEVEDRLFTAEGFDAETGETVLSVNGGFGREIPVGFQPFQFRAQLGIRYRF